MEVRKKEDIIKARKIYSGGWILGMFELKEYELIKENKKSFRFKVRGIMLDFVDGNVNGKEKLEYETTIDTDKILYGNIPFFTERKEAINYFIEALKNELEKLKKKIEILPKIINNMEKVLYQYDKNN